MQRSPFWVKLFSFESSAIKHKHTRSLTLTKILFSRKLRNGSLGHNCALSKKFANSFKLKDLIDYRLNQVFYKAYFNFKFFFLLRAWIV